MTRYRIQVRRPGGSIESHLMDSEGPLDIAYKDACMLIEGKYECLLVIERAQ